MKRRKAPVLLLSLLVVLVGAFLVIGMRKADQDQPPVVSNEQTDIPSDQAVKSQIAQASHAKPKAMVDTAANLPMMPATGNGPSIAIPKPAQAQANAPKPDPNGTVGSEWYRR